MNSVKFLKFKLVILIFFLALANGDDKRILRWKQLPGAVSYDLEVSKNQKSVLKKKVPEGKTQWKIEVEPGIYLYRVRAIDAAGRPGNWSQVHGLKIAPTSPAKISPKMGEVFVLGSPNLPRALVWAPGKASKYEATLWLGGKKLVNQVVEGTKVDLPELAGGRYEWEVRAIYEATGPLPPTIKSRILKSPSKRANFIVEEVKLLKVANLKTQKPVAQVQDAKRVKLSWDSVPHAEAYEVRIIESLPGRRGRRRLLFPKKNFVEIEVTEGASYEWTVRALAKVDSFGVAAFRGPATTHIFKPK